MRTACSCLLIFLSLVLAPVAAVGTWARVQLVDTDTFVSTFAPLSQDRSVQDFLSEKVSDQISEQLDVPHRVDTLFASASVTLPEPAAGAVRGATVAGLESLIDAASRQVVTSQQFSNAWETSLRLTHRRAVAVLDDDPSARVTISKDGVLSLRIDPFVQAAKDRLAKRGMPFADEIHVQERSIPIISSSSLALTRAAYRAATIGGFWMPWVVLALFVGGVMVAHRRRRALGIGSLLMGIVFVLLSVGVWIGGRVFVGAVSPGEIPEPMASAVFDQVTALMSSTLRALAVLGVLVAVGCWLVGPARPAVALRSVWDSGFGSVRAALDRNGGDTGSFGRLVDRFRKGLMILAVIIGIALLMVTRPVDFGSIAWMVLGLFVFAVFVELVRRPADDESSGDGSSDVTTEATDESTAEATEEATAD